MSKIWAAVVALLMVSGTVGCGDGDEGGLSEEEEQLLADEKYGETEFYGANVGGLIQADDDNLRLGVLSSDGESAQLDVYLKSDPDLQQVETVEYLSVFVVGPYRVQVVTLGDQDVAVEVAKEN